jgi:3-deoxy-D-manno-octulosonic-acid transferase
LTPFWNTGNIPPLMQRPSMLYRAAARLAHQLLPLAGALNPKIRAGHEARGGVVARIEQWAGRKRETGRPLVWFHAPSVGEGRQAESIIQAFERRHPQWQVAYTYFSPSAESLAERLQVDIADYLPYDLPSDMDRVLDALRPDALVFTKLDLWPELATRAARRGTSVVIAAATVRPGSGRLRWPVRRLLHPGYAVVQAAGVISPDDGERLLRLGVPADAIRVTGDPRMDSVDLRRGAVDPGEPLLRLGDGATTLIAGSTWPSDERAVLSAFARIRQAHSGVRLVVVPHEPTERHLQQLDSVASRLRLPRPIRLSRLDEPGEVIVVDRVGVLAALYGAGDMTYVGGGFGRAGLHSVLEPAAWSVPVVFGPRWRDSRDAHLLINAGGAHGIGAADPERASGQLAEIWGNWLTDAETRRNEGRRAREVIDRGRGASDRTVDLIEAAAARTGSGSRTQSASHDQRGTTTPS